MSAGWTGFEVAVIGMAARFPGAPDVERFWRNLCEGVESISFLSTGELELPPGHEGLRDNPAYIRAAPLLDGVDLFDAEFFGFSGREAEITDPQQRLLLECAWEALEDGGYDPAHTRLLTGIYAGSLLNDYLGQVRSSPELAGHADPVKVLLGNEKDYLASRVAYKLSLEGPAVTVQTACSTSLVAVHLACQGLLAGDCDLALAGGIAVKLPQKAGYLYREGEIFSPDGHCRAFDAAAQGTVFGSGMGLVVLRRLADALAAGDTVRAVIKGSATNNDGSQKVGFTAPRVEGQARVIRSAQIRADVDPATLGLVEAHGTGTPVGDPIELQALTRAFRAATPRRGFCALGAVKTNVGHLNTAAGIAGLIKVVKALEHELIPPNLHFERPLPALDLDQSPFYIPVRLTPWRRGERPRRAAVSSFGIGGTNAHVIVEEAPLPVPSTPSRPAALLTLSARTPDALGAMAARLAAHLEAHPELAIADVAYTLHVGRGSFPYRWSASCCDPGQAVAALTACRDRLTAGERPAAARQRPVIFTFPGQGTRLAARTAGLYQNEPEFRRAIDHGAELLRPALGLDLRKLLTPGEEDREAAEGRLSETWLAQPVLFLVEHALARLLMHWGLKPQGLLGHSLGEYVAACLAGVFSLEDGLRLVTVRGRLMQQLPGGAMLALPLAEPEARALAQGELALAAVNGPQRTVLSGPAAAIAEVEETLTRRGVECRRLATAHAFHSAMMEPAVEPLARQLAGVRLAPPEIPFLSNLTGTWIEDGEATDPAYWVRHLRETVRFGDGLAEALRLDAAALVEVGPGRTLSQLARRHPNRQPDHLVVSSLGETAGSTAEVTALLDSLGALWCGGVEPRWQEVHAHERRRRVPLPTYPFERQRYWVGGYRPAVGNAAQKERRPFEDWFSIPSFRRSAVPTESTTAPRRWLLLADALGVGEEIRRRLEARGESVVTATPGAAFGRLAVARYTLDPGRAEDYDALLHATAMDGPPLAAILHLWTLGPAGSREADLRALGFDSLLLLAQALGRDGFGGPGEKQRRLRLIAVSNGIEEVSGDEELIPEKATLLGPVKVIPREMPGVSCQLIDVPLPEDPAAGGRLASQILAEALADAPPSERVVAYRGRHRWVQGLEPLQLSAATGIGGLRRHGVYLITGGLGGLGFTLARHLAESAAARLVLLARSPVGRRVWQLQELEALGAEVLALAADVSQPEDLGQALAQARERFGRIDGVLHAAGLPGGGLLQLRTREEAAAVLAPKVAGTLALWEAVARDAPDFVLLFSSTLSVTGGVGQVDYCAANCFLEAFARSRARGGTYVQAVSWDAWEEVGMAAAHRAGGSGTAGHPLLGLRAGTAGKTVWQAELSTARHWEVAEHRLRGRGLVPATALLEMMTAALVEELGGLPVVLEDFSVPAPLWVDEGVGVTVRTVVESQGEGFALRVLSRGSESAAGEWREHAVARGLAVPPAAPPRRAPFGVPGAELREVPVAELSASRAGLDWGPRWESLRRVERGTREAVAELELPGAYAAEPAVYHLHPALLDVATSFALPLLAPGPYVPFLYGRLTVHGRLPARVISHARRREEAPRGDLAVFDIAIADKGGVPLLTIEGLAFRSLEHAAAPLAAGAAAAPFTSMTHGIRPDEGVEVFRRLLMRPDLPHVVVAVGDLGARLSAMEAVGPAAAMEKGRGASHPRPSLSSPYIAPGNEIERTLTVLWQELLGYDKVGVEDNFFELGGDSLLGVQMLTRAAQTGLRLTVGQLFQQQTIAALASIAQASAADEPISAAPAEEDAFPAAELSREDLDQILARFGSAGV
ncbi:MAG TPA: SDR family NAD(P)-dependent oxidoreductase [Thermoanaerobaculia bacterium]|nr:SDR family NAD(P)-dependent oxidoreductase [Thermoanaerobaculia bacterium]